jgi:hypothetical protein
MDSFDTAGGGVEVKLDGASVSVPSERRTFSAIRSYLEALALQQQRILCWITVDGEAVPLTQPRHVGDEFALVEGETMDLSEVPLQLIKGALHQTGVARERVRSAVDLILINDSGRARELWWTLSTVLKEPLLTLSLVPDGICGPENGRAPLIQLRKWQLQQLGCVIQDVDEACRWEDPGMVSDALEQRVLPWLDHLHESLEMWLETVSSHPSAKACRDA